MASWNGSGDGAPTDGDCSCSCAAGMGDSADARTAHGAVSASAIRDVNKVPLSCKPAPSVKCGWLIRSMNPYRAMLYFTPGLGSMLFGRPEVLAGTHSAPF